MNRLTKILLPFLFLFSISFSSLIQPENGTSINYTHVLFEWEQEFNASSYTLYLDTSSNFSNPTEISDNSLIYIDTENTFRPERIVSIANSLVMLVSAVILIIIGFILDQFWLGEIKGGVHIYTPFAYQIAYLVMPAMSLIALIAALYTRKYF